MKYGFAIAKVLMTMFLSLNLHAHENIEKIIGTDDLVAVNADATNIPLSYQRLVDAFGMIGMGCTATHIGNGYVLTAGHCFNAPSHQITNRPCRGETIRWGVRQGKAAYLTSQCESIVAARLNDTLDYAILKVSPVPPVAVGVELRRKANGGNRVTIFSHPDMRPLQWSKYCFVQGSVSYPRLSPGTLQHKCDTNPGSSGATILDVFTKKVVGIHDGGILLYRGEGMNYGTYLTAPEIVQALRSVGFQ